MKMTSVKQKIGLVLLGIFFTVILLEIGLGVGGTIFLWLQESRNLSSIKKKGTYRILCLGESTTALGGQNSYPRQLEKILNNRIPEVRFIVINKGKPIIRTTDILSTLETNLIKYKPDFVITMMGINDGLRIVKYNDDQISRNFSFLKKLRIYKLTRLIKLHVLSKIREKELVGLGANAEILFSPKNISDQDLQNDREEREKNLMKNIGMDYRDRDSYIELAKIYKENMELDKAEGILKKAIEINPKHDLAYVKLGECYLEQKKFEMAEEVLSAVIKRNPRMSEAYVELGYYYMFVNDYKKAEELLKKAIEINPRDADVYVSLGWFFRNQRMYGEAEEILKKAVEMLPRDDGIYAELASFYRSRNRYREAEEVLKKAIEINPENEEAYDEILALRYQSESKIEPTISYLQSVDNTGEGPPISVTPHNYQRLREMVLENGIKLVCVQYPIRKVELLKKMFRDKSGIVFVDNEKIFKEAVIREGYDEYFIDNFAGNFGHCTIRGNRLLAENVANVIVKTFFSK